MPSVAKGTGAARSLTSPSQLAIDWVALAAGMGVPARAAATAEEFAECVRRGLATEGPFLIHAKLLAWVVSARTQRALVLKDGC